MYPGGCSQQLAHHQPDPPPAKLTLHFSDNATSQHRVSEQAVLGRLPWCPVILLLRDSKASTNTTGHSPLMCHKRNRLKMSVLTLAAWWNLYAEPSSVCKDRVKGTHITSSVPWSCPLPHMYSPPRWAAPRAWPEWPQCNDSEPFLMSTQLV